MLELFDRSGLDLGIEVMKRLGAIRHTRCLALLGMDQPSKLAERCNNSSGRTY